MFLPEFLPSVPGQPSMKLERERALDHARDLVASAWAEFDEARDIEPPISADLLATLTTHEEVYSQSIFTTSNRPSICTRTACQCQGIHDETLSSARLARQDGEAGAELYAYGINNCEPSNAKLTNL